MPVQEFIDLMTSNSTDDYVYYSEEIDYVCGDLMEDISGVVEEMLLADTPTPKPKSDAAAAADAKSDAAAAADDAKSDDGFLALVCLYVMGVTKMLKIFPPYSLLEKTPTIFYLTIKFNYLTIPASSSYQNYTQWSWVYWYSL